MFCFRGILSPNNCWWVYVNYVWLICRQCWLWSTIVILLSLSRYDLTYSYSLFICYRDEMTITKTVLIQQCWNYLLRSQVQNKVNDHRTLGVRVTIYLWYGLGSSILDSSHHILGSYCNNGEIAPIDTGHVNTVPTHWLKNMDGCNASLCATSFLWERAL